MGTMGQLRMVQAKHSDINCFKNLKIRMVKFERYLHGEGCYTANLKNLYAMSVSQ